MLSVRQTAVRAAAGAGGARQTARGFRATAVAADKVVLVLYPDPVNGYPPNYARDSVPTIEVYPDGQTSALPPGPRPPDSRFNLVNVSLLLACSSRPYGNLLTHRTWLSPDPERDRLHPGRAARMRVRRARPPQVPREQRPHAGRHRRSVAAGSANLC